MRPRILPSLVAVFALIAASGCVPEDAGYDDVRRITAERIGRDVRWHAMDGTGAAGKRTRELLAAPLTAAGAVEIALLNNAGLQASFEELGIARASLVTARRLPNPTAEAALRFEGGDRPDIDVRVLEDVSDLFLLPLRSGAASSELDAAKASVAGAVLDVALEARMAYYEYQAALQLLELHTSIVDATRASAETAQHLHDAGNVTNLALASEQALLDEALLSRGAAEATASAARERLTAVLGLGAPSSAFRVTGRLPALPAQEIAAASVEQNAVKRSLDLEGIRRRYEAAARRANYSRARGLVPELGVGVEAEREERWGIGPAAELTLPLFYQGQGEVARARAEMRREEHAYRDVALRVRAAARAGATRLLALREAATRYEKVILPRREQIVKGTLLEYNAMSASVFQLLEAKRAQIETARAYVENLRAYWLVRAEVESLVSGRLSRGAGPSAGVPTAAGAPSGDGPGSSEH